MWLTHMVNYADFPKSLRVLCVFDTKNSLNHVTAANTHHTLRTSIQRYLFKIDVIIKLDQINFATKSQWDQRPPPQ
jgi:hypothetical protein